MRVIDSHVHFPSEKIIDDGKGLQENPSPFTSTPKDPWIQWDKRKWSRAWRFPDPEHRSLTEAEEGWRREVDTYPYLKKVVFVTTGSNEHASALVSRHPDRFIAYAHHDPLLPDAPDRLSKAIRQQGLRGYKLLGPKVEKPLDDPSLFPLWETARDLKIPVLIHFGILGGAGGIAHHPNMNPLIIHAVAKAFPTLPIIVPHFGCGYVFETLQLAWACPNIYVDTSGSNQWMRWMPYELTLEKLFSKFRETLGPRRILFGTDSSWFPRGFAQVYLDEQIRAMVYTGYSEEEQDLVLYANAARLLGLE